LGSEERFIATGAWQAIDLLLLDVNPCRPPVAPLGLEILASALEPHGWKVRILSASPFLSDYENRLSLLGRLAPRALGLQIRNHDSGVLGQSSPALPEFYAALARALRRLYGKAPLILGGAGFSIDPPYWLALLAADFGVVGSGEEPLRQLLDALLRGQGDPCKAPNVVSARYPDRARRRHHLRELGAVSRSPRELLRWQAVADQSVEVPWSNLELQRGCPYRCSFCVEPRVYGGKLVRKPVGHVMAELDTLAEAGVSRVFFACSEFNLDAAHSRELCRALERAAQRVKWSTYVSPTGLSPSLTNSMVAGGCESISVNAVHSSDEILESLGCPHRLVDITASILAAEQAGLATSWTFLVGSSRETDRSLRELMSLVDARGLRATIVAGVALYPNLPRPRADGMPLIYPLGASNVRYCLNLTPAQVALLTEWAASRSLVRLANPPHDLEVVAKRLAPTSDGAHE
jgi:radical SAM superfamily enzyme YgiQ (UPF0313 family)